jgi:hypothetical protein
MSTFKPEADSAAAVTAPLIPPPMIATSYVVDEMCCRGVRITIKTVV